MDLKDIVTINLVWVFNEQKKIHEESFVPDFPFISLAFRFLAFINERVKMEFEG